MTSTTEEAAEGRDAFLQKRPPIGTRFRGTTRRLLSNRPVVVPVSGGWGISVIRIGVFRWSP